MSSDSMRESLYLVDAHSLIYQVFHALPEMTSPAGLPTNATFGFAKDMLFLRNEKKPTYLIVCFDVSGKTFRDDLVGDYKANRAPMPDDLQLQIPMIRQMLEAMRIPVLGITGYEADDLIATLAHAGAQRDIDVFICSSDKDCRQLIGDRVRIFNLRKREIFDRDSLKTDWGIAPEQVIDYQTLVGDSVDNVKGVPGIGPKTASQLLNQFQTLDNLLANVDQVPGKKKEAIKASLGILETSRKLVRLATDAPVDFQWDAWKMREFDGPELFDLFRGWGFRGLADQVKNATNGAPAADATSKPKPILVQAGQEIQGSLFADPPIEVAATPTDATPWDATYYLVSTTEQFDKFLTKLKKQKRFALDLETTSLVPRQAEIVGYAISWKPGEAYYVAVKGPVGEAVLESASVRDRLKPIFEDPKIAKINQNIKYDWQVLRQQGVYLQGVVGDSMVADYLLHAGERGHNLDMLSEKHLGHKTIAIDTLIGKGKSQKRMDQVSPAKIAQYAGEDADVAFRLCDKLEKELDEIGLRQLYCEVELPLIEVLADMEFTGIRLDVPFLQNLSADMTGRLAQLEQDIYRLAGKEFNIASVTQLRKVLFEEQGFKSVKKTNITGAASTDSDVLEELAKEHELPRQILRQRQLAKLKGTYVDALPTLVNPATGRVHTSFNQTVAATGRLSSSDPNLQNIPIRSEEGEQIRRAFLPEAGWQLVAADYSQIELRLLAHFSGDENLRRAFDEGKDIHASVAAQVFNVDEKDVDGNQRRMAKTINFGLIYGISAFGLAARLEISRDEAAKFIDAYFARFPKVLEYQEQLLATSLKRGYVSTILGRRRAIGGIRASTNYRNRNQPEREAINMEIQGSAADLIKLAMLNLHRRLKSEKRQTQLLLQIHDELVFEAPPGEMAEIVPIIRKEMTQALGDRVQVPIEVDMNAGPNWLDSNEIAA